MRKTRSVWPTSRPHARSSARVVTMHHVWLFLREFEVRTTFALLFVIRGSVCLRAQHIIVGRETFFGPQPKRGGRNKRCWKKRENFFSLFWGGCFVFFYLFCLMKEGKDTPPRYLFLSGFALKWRERESSFLLPLKVAFKKKEKKAVFECWMCSRARARERVCIFTGFFSLSFSSRL